MIKILYILGALLAVFILYRKLSKHSEKKKNFKLIKYTSILFLIFVSLIFIFILTKESNIDKEYNSPSFKDGKLVPGFFGEEENEN